MLNDELIEAIESFRLLAREGLTKIDRFTCTEEELRILAEYDAVCAKLDVAIAEYLGNRKH